MTMEPSTPGPSRQRSNQGEPTVSTYGKARPWRARCSFARILLPASMLALLAACSGGGGGYGGDDGGGNGGAAAKVAEGQFVDESIEGLGFSAADGVEGKTDASGKFKFAVGQPVQFFVGSGVNRVVIGTGTPAATKGAGAFSLQDLNEVQNDNDQYLGNLVNFLIALDEDNDISNGIRISAATESTVKHALAGGKRINFNQTAAAFAADQIGV